MNQAIKFHCELQSDNWKETARGNFMTIDLMLQWLKRIPNRHASRSTRGIVRMQGRHIWFKDGSELRLK